MKVTVCELNHDNRGFESEWEALADHVNEEKSDLVLLPELIFSPWFPASKPFQPDVWEKAVRDHETAIRRFPRIPSVWWIGTRPVNRRGRRLNEAFAWSLKTGAVTFHEKAYLPDEAGFQEAGWYHPGSGRFQALDLNGLRAGAAICTDIWFFRHARSYAEQGIHLLLHPRATLLCNLEKWLTAGRTAAVVSGAFCLSSNRYSRPGTDPELGGMGYIAGPEGEVLGETSQHRLFLTLDIDLSAAERAKTTYPRYIREIDDDSTRS